MKLVEAQEGRRILDRLVRLRGVERRVPPHRPRHVGGTRAERRHPSRRRPRARPHGVPQRLVLGPRGHVRRAATTRRRRRSRRRSSRSTASASRSGRDFDADTGALNAERRRRAARRGRRAPRSPTRLEDAAVHRRVGRDHAVHAERPEGAVHHVDAAAGGGPQARLQRGAARCTSPRASTSGASSPTCGPTRTSLSEQAVQRAPAARSRKLYGDAYLPEQPREYRSKVKNAQEAHEAIRPAGDAHAHRRRRRPRAARHRRASPLRPHLEAHGRVADGRRPHPARHAPARGDVERAARTSTFQASGRTIEFPGYLRAYVEGADDPDAELEDRETMLPPLDEGEAVACRELRAVGSHHAAAGALHRGERW